MIQSKLYTAILFSFLLASCLFDSGSDNVAGDYEVVWIDTFESRALSKGEEIVSEYVYAVGHDSKYIYVKQHPLNYNSSKRIDESITNYYIVEMTESAFQNKPVYGPLTKNGFDSLSNVLGIKDLDFDMTYPTNF